jgi:hypothetical protein
VAVFLKDKGEHKKEPPARQAVFIWSDEFVNSSYFNVILSLSQIIFEKSTRIEFAPG